MEIKITSTGLDRMTEQIELAQDRIGDLAKVSDQVAQLIRDDINTRFLLSPATATGGMAHGGVEYRKLSNMAFQQNPKRMIGQIHIDSGTLWRGAITPGAKNIYYTDGDTFFFELTGENVDELQRLRPIVFWHPELLEKVAKLVSEAMFDDERNPLPRPVS